MSDKSLRISCLFNDVLGWYKIIPKSKGVYDVCVNKDFRFETTLELNAILGKLLYGELVEAVIEHKVKLYLVDVVEWR